MLLTQEQEMIRDTMRAFAQERLAPFAAEWDKNHTFPAQALKELGELGALGMVVPEEWDGAGMDYMSLVLTLEEIAAGDGAVGREDGPRTGLALAVVGDPVLVRGATGPEQLRHDELIRVRAWP